MQGALVLWLRRCPWWKRGWWIQTCPKLLCKRRCFWKSLKAPGQRPRCSSPARARPAGHAGRAERGNATQPPRPRSAKWAPGHEGDQPLLAWRKPQVEVAAGAACRGRSWRGVAPHRRSAQALARSECASSPTGPEQRLRTPADVPRARLLILRCGKPCTEGSCFRKRRAQPVSKRRESAGARSGETNSPARLTYPGMVLRS